MQTERETPPLRFASPGDYEKIVAALRRADFTEDAVCRTLGLGNMSDLNSEHAANSDLNATAPGLALFIRLFLFFETVARLELDVLLDRETVDAFLACDILRPVDENAHEYYSSVFLYPVAGFHIASDRPVDPDGIVREREDWVLPAIYEGTLKFLDRLITSPCGEALDLCAGTGIGAMVLSRNARKAVAVDITERATHYARFNAQLNHRQNVEILESNLYEALQGRTFDRIIAHPPYVPTIHSQPVFSDGGETGEYLVRKLLEDLPQYLRPGGTYYSISFNIDTEDAPFEARVRKWLGAWQEEFDILFAQTEVRPIEQVIENIVEKQSMTHPDDIARLCRAFEGIKATQFAYGHLVLRRRAAGEEGAPATMRIELTAETSENDLENMLKNCRATSPDA